MIGRTLFYGLVFCVAVGLPYLTSNWSKKSPTTEATAAVHSDSAAAVHSQVSQGPTLAISTPAPLPASESHPPLVDMFEAFRFDVSPSYLMQRWPRVMAGLPRENLQGYRVPLVTGTHVTDVAGSLTYYFNPQQQCQRIEFRGSTGNPQRLVQLLTQYYGLTRQMTSDAGMHLYQTRWNGSAISELQVRTSQIVKSASPHSRYEVELRLQNWRS